MNFGKLKLILFSIISLFLSFESVFADGWKMETNWPASPAGAELTPDATIAELVAYIYEWGITIGVLIFFAVLVFSGFKYVTSAGSPDKISKAKKGIISSLSGMVLLLGSFLLLSLINPDLIQIEKVIISNPPENIHEFQARHSSGENLCEFSIVITQEKEKDNPEAHFMIPGMSIATEPIFPVKSAACSPEVNENQILEVRTNTDIGAYTLVRKMDGKEVDSSKRVYFGSNIQDLRDLYGKRYKEMEDYRVPDHYDIYGYLSNLGEKNLYNIFEECEEIIKYPQFNRPRCLDMSDEGDYLKIKEWRRVGFASLTKAMSSIGDLDNIEVDQGCPTSTTMDGNLGYFRDRSGGGCELSFYDGTERSFVYFGKETITCEEKISGPAASMMHFDGIVDRPSNCMLLSRHDPPLQDLKAIEEIKESMLVPLIVDREAAINNPNKSGHVYVCRGMKEDSDERTIFTCNDYRVRHGDRRVISVPPGEYTLIIRGMGWEYFNFEDTSDCLKKGDINDGLLLNSMDKNCLTEIREKKEFKLIEEDPDTSVIGFREEYELEGVLIEIEPYSEIKTNQDGEASVNLPNNDYVFNATLEGYENFKDSFTVSSSNRNISFEMEIITYNVVFEDFDESTIDQQEVNYGEDADAPDDPERGGYIFEGWDKNFTKITRDMTVTAQYSPEPEPDEHTVAFEEENELEEVSIIIDGYDEIKTNQQGRATKNLLDGDYSFSAALKGYHSLTNQPFTIDGADKEIPFKLNPQEHTITFEEENEKEDVEIRVYSDQEKEDDELKIIAFTKSQGKKSVDFKTGQYWFTASLEEHKNYEGDFYIDEDKTINFEMDYIEYNIKFTEERKRGDVHIDIYSDQSRKDLAKSLTTNHNGEVSGSLPGGQYWFTASLEDNERSGKEKDIYNDYKGLFVLSQDREIDFRIETYKIRLNAHNTRILAEMSCDSFCSYRIEDDVSCVSIGTDEQASNQKYVDRAYGVGIPPWSCEENSGDCSTALGTRVTNPECPSQYGDEEQVKWTYCRCKIE